MRGDWPLIKHLSKTYNPEVGEQWQRLPYVEFVLQDVLDRATDIRSRFTTLDHLPWRDCQLRATNGWFGFVRAVALEDWLAGPMHLSPWSQVPPDFAIHFVGKEDRLGRVRFRPTLPMDFWEQRESMGDDDRWLLLEYWPDGLDRPFPYRMVVDRHAIWDGWFIDDDLPTVFKTQIGSDSPVTVLRAGGPHGKALQADTAELLLPYVALLVSLQARPEYLVELTPVPPDGEKPLRRGNPKPWTNEHLPRIVLIDPQKVPPPPEVRTHDGKADEPASRTSKRPHQRRGHWATLHHPKFYQGEYGLKYDPHTNPRRVFVKPAWVGPREWIMEGTRYRVIDSTVESLSA